MKRLFVVSSSSTAWSSNFTAAIRLALFLALLLLPGSVIVLPLLGWIRHKAAHAPATPTAHTPGAHA